MGNASDINSPIPCCMNCIRRFGYAAVLIINGNEPHHHALYLIHNEVMKVKRTNHPSDAF